MRKDKKWWLPPLSYTYVGPRQAVPTGLLEPQAVQDVSPVIGLTQTNNLGGWLTPSYEPIPVSLSQVQWHTGAVSLPDTVTNALENQATSAYAALPVSTSTTPSEDF